MVGLSLYLDLVAATALVALAFLVIFLIYAVFTYGPVIRRIFELRPVFLPLRVSPEDLGEAVTFTTDDGLELSGSFLGRRNPQRVGLLVFCHEYLSDRWSYLPYLDQLRDVGYDVFTFDFRNHGSSASDPDYAPLQWATDYEVRDLRAALACLRDRPDHDQAGFGLIGVSRGGSTALVVGSEEPDVWGVVTDGAFPTLGTITAYMFRWAEIFVRSRLLLALFPGWLYSFLGWVSLLDSQRRLKCRFPDIETAARRLSPRPWLLIHGERDAYISPEIARSLYDHAREPKEIWLVPAAKHNRCRECEPEAYAARITEFLGQHAPRRPVTAAAPSLTHAAMSLYSAEPGRPVGSPRLIPSATASVTS
ncbi:MAG: alpha/beta hydrolase [Isosphaeraceae bacterium]